MNPLAIGGVIVAVAMGIATVQTWRLDRVKGELVEARLATKAAEKLAADTAAFRKQDQDNAATAYGQLQASCIEDVQGALSRGRTIERIIQAPAPAAGAPRGRVDADSLRGIVGQEAEPRAAPRRVPAEP